MKSVDKDKLTLDKEKVDLDRKRLALETKGHGFKTYVVPLSSIVTTFLVALIALMSYCGQQDSKKAELELARERFKLDFIEKQRDSNTKARGEFHVFIDANRARLESPRVSEKVAVADQILERFGPYAPELLTTFLEDFLVESLRVENQGSTASTGETCTRDEKICQDEKNACQRDLANCLDQHSELLKRAGLVNRVRLQLNKRVTVYVRGGSDVNRLMKAFDVIRNEGFTPGKVSDYSRFMDERAPPARGSQVLYFFDRDETFARTLAAKLNSAEFERKGSLEDYFLPVLQTEIDPLLSRKILVQIGD